MGSKSITYWIVAALATLAVIGSFLSGSPGAVAQNGYPPPEYPMATPGAQPYRLSLPVLAKKSYGIVPKSYYMTVEKAGFQPGSLGQQAAIDNRPILVNGDKVLFVLAWGQPCKYTSSPLVYGAYAYQGSCKPLSSFESHIKNFIDGYCGQLQAIQPGSGTQHCGYQYNAITPVTIALGVDNCAGGLDCANLDNNPSNQVNAGHAQQWAAVVNSVATYLNTQGYNYQVRVAGAMDIEGAWNTYNSTSPWVSAFVAAAPSLRLYNYGDCNAPEGYSSGNNNVIGPPIFPRDWSYDRLHYVSVRASGLTNPLPQIYHNSGSDARKWQGLSKWATLNPGGGAYGKIVFPGLLTESNRTLLQGAPCNGICNLPTEATLQMSVTLNSDAATANGLATPLSNTDILFYPWP